MRRSRCPDRGDTRRIPESNSSAPPRDPKRGRFADRRLRVHAKTRRQGGSRGGAEARRGTRWRERPALQRRLGKRNALARSPFASLRLRVNPRAASAATRTRSMPRRFRPVHHVRSSTCRHHNTSTARPTSIRRRKGGSAYSPSARLRPPNRQTAPSPIAALRSLRLCATRTGRRDRRNRTARTTARRPRPIASDHRRVDISTGQHSTTLTASPPRLVSLYCERMSSPVWRIVSITASRLTTWLPSPRSAR